MKIADNHIVMMTENGGVENENECLSRILDTGDKDKIILNGLNQTIRLKIMRSILKEFYVDWVAGYIDQAIRVSSTVIWNNRIIVTRGIFI